MRAWPALFALAACSQKPSEISCFVPPIVGVADANAGKAKAADWSQHSYTCINHWAAVLASSPDSPYPVSDAVLASCDWPIGFEATAIARENPGLYQNAEEALQALKKTYRSEALLGVERYRAAHCQQG